MENNFSTKSSVTAAGIAGYASPIFLAVAVLGLCIAMFLIALPGVAGQLDSTGQKTSRSAATIPVELSMSTADQHLQIAESFNAIQEQSAAQAEAQQDTLTAAK